MILEKLNVVYEWLFTEEERAPIGDIPTLALTIRISTGICWFMLNVFGVVTP